MIDNQVTLQPHGDISKLLSRGHFYLVLTVLALRS
jgi:hypothetical protein